MCKCPTERFARWFKLNRSKWCKYWSSFGGINLSINWVIQKYSITLKLLYLLNHSTNDVLSEPRLLFSFWYRSENVPHLPDFMECETFSFEVNYSFCIVDLRSWCLIEQNTRYLLKYRRKETFPRPGFGMSHLRLLIIWYVNYKVNVITIDQ